MTLNDMSSRERARRREWMRNANTFWSRWTPRLGALFIIPAMFVAACSVPGGENSSTGNGQLSGACAGSHPATQTTPSGDLGSPITGSTGAVPSTQAIHLNIALNVNYTALAACDQQLHDPSSPNYGLTLTPQQVASTFAPSASDVAKVTKFLTDNGLTVSQTYTTNAALSVDGTAAQVEKAFNVQLLTTSNGGYGPNQSPTLPSDIQGLISSITGLKTEGAAHCNIDNPKNGQNCGLIHHFSHFTAPKVAPQTAKVAHDNTDCTLDSIGTPISGLPSGTLLRAQDLSSSYGLDNLYSAGFNGKGTSIGIVEFDTFLPSDLSNYERCVDSEVASTRGFKTFSDSRVQVVNVDVGSSDPSATSGAGAGEATLDFELAAGLTSKDTNLIDYYAPNNANWEAEFQDILHKVASDKKVTVLSVSYGDFERDLTPSYAASVNDTLKILVAEGISTFVASGDCAAYGAGQFGNRDVDFPSSAPYAISVGGTTLTAGGGILGGGGSGRQDETTWVDDSAKAGAACQNTWGSGGGVSVIPSFTIPSWQTGTGVSNQFSTGARQLPDVSAAGINISFYYSAIPGTPLWLGVGGTSAAAPIWAAGTDVVNQALAAKGKAPLAGPQTIYSLANGSNGSQAFFDVTKGDNLFFKAGKGWDYPSGWGSPNFDKIVSALGG